MDTPTPPNSPPNNTLPHTTPLKCALIISINIIIFLFGSLSLAIIYFSIFEYSFDIADISLLEVFFVLVMLQLLKRHYLRCRENILSPWETLRRPFIFIGWTILCLTLLMILLLVFDNMKLDGDHHPDSLGEQLILFGTSILSVLLGTPKASSSKHPNAEATKSTEASS